MDREHYAERPLSDRQNAIFLFGKYQTAQEVIDHWYERGTQSRPPCRQTINDWLGMFMSKGSVRRIKPPGPDKIVLTPRFLIAVQNSLERYPHIPYWERAQKVGASVGTTHAAVQILKFHPYRMRVVQELKEGDPEKRISFARSYLQLIADDPTIVDNIWFSDECHFSLDETVNSYNCYYYAKEKPDFTSEKSYTKKSVKVWCAISKHGIYGPVIYIENMDGIQYRKLLTTLFFPYLRDKGWLENAWFQQDGAPSHTAKASEATIREVLGEKFIGDSSQISWPPRSPDITPPDFFLWGFLKDIVYRVKHETTESLEIALQNTIRAIPIETICRSIDSVARRCEMLLENGGKQIQ